VIGLQVLREKKVPIQSVITHYRVNIWGTEGGTTVTSFRNTDRSGAEGTAVPSTFNAFDVGRVGRNM
jgi:hypothetical protein